VVLYGLLRICAIRFYSQFGVQPEEVGLTYAQLLAQSAAAYLALFLLLAAGALVAFFCIALAEAIVTALLRWCYRAAVKRKAPINVIDRLARWTQDYKGAVRWALFPASYVALAYFVVAAGSFWSQSRELALDLQQGTSINRTFDITSWHSVLRLYNNLLSLRADQVTVFETNAAGSGLSLQSRQALFYLGQASGTAIFYDSATKETLRVPASGLVICRPQTGGSCVEPESFAGVNAVRARAKARQALNDAPNAKRPLIYSTQTRSIANGKPTWFVHFSTLVGKDTKVHRLRRDGDGQDSDAVQPMLRQMSITVWGRLSSQTPA
jgi:hypothetical protein